MKSLIAAAMRLAVVKSGLRSASRTWLSRLSANSISRSMMRAVGDAADGRHAARDLGGFAFGLEAADRERALRDRIDVAVGAEQRRDQQRAALQALGVAERETVTSMRVPWVPKAGRLAVTITAATLPVRIVCPRMLTPSRSSIACSDCLVNGMLLRVSPVPLRPTTRP